MGFASYCWYHLSEGDILAGKERPVSNIHGIDYSYWIIGWISTKEKVKRRLEMGEFSEHKKPDENSAIQYMSIMLKILGMG